MKHTLYMALGLLLAFCASSAETGRAMAQDGTKAVIHGDRVRGQVIAARWCASCHDTGVGNASDQVPSFANVAKRQKGAVLRAFLHAPHKPMPPLQLTNQEIEDLAVFIESLK